MKIILLSLLIALPGCGLYECIDMRFPRRVKPIGEVFDIQLELQQQSFAMQVRCEEYYDAMCAERGNYWSVREVGYVSDFQTSAFRFTDDKLGEIEVPIPRCVDMARGRQTPLER